MEPRFLGETAAKPKIRGHMSERLALAEQTKKASRLTCVLAPETTGKVRESLHALEFRVECLVLRVV